MDKLFLITGLGNPGTKYADTRHNVGFDTVDLLSCKYKIGVSRLKFKALIGEGTIEDERVILAKPQTYMNASGESVREIVDWYKIPYGNIIIICDDVDLPPGKLRIRPYGSAGTHNGMKSVIFQTQTDQFPRVRIGIGRAPEGWDLADYVLGRFTPEERKTIDAGIARAADAVSTILKSGVEKAMNLYNG